MPLYDYWCRECNSTFEASRKIADRESCECPKCGATADKLVSAPTVALDGTDPSFPGAYLKWGNDYKKRVAQAQKREDN